MPWKLTSNAHPGTRILGSLGSADSTGVVRIEDRYDTEIDDLWSALTEPGRRRPDHPGHRGSGHAAGQDRLLRGPGGRSTPKVSPPTSPGVSPATPRHDLTSSSPVSGPSGQHPLAQ